MIQDEDRGHNFEDMMRNAEDVDRIELRKNIKPLSKASIDELKPFQLELHNYLIETKSV